VTVGVSADRQDLRVGRQPRGDMDGNPCRDVAVTSSRASPGDAALHHVIAFALSPATLVTHAVMLSILHALVVEGGLRHRQLGLLLFAEELLVYVLWLSVDHGLRAPFAIWICVTVYEAIVRPRVRYHDQAVLLTGTAVISNSTQL